MPGKIVLIALLLWCVAGPAAEPGTAEPAPPEPTIMQTAQDTNLYYAPNKQIGVLKTGARVEVLKQHGDWAYVKYADKKILVRGWVEKKYLQPAAKTDPLRGLQNQRNSEN